MMSNRILMEEHQRTQKTIEQVDIHTKLIQIVSKRQEELARSIETVRVSVGEVLDKACVLVSKQKARIDTVIEDIG
jgi:hypothetical protein